MNTARTVQSVLFATLVMACGAKTNPSLCDQQGVNANPVCNQVCDPQPGAPTSCPTGFHCDPAGKCDAQCDATHACTTGYTCELSTGTCTLDPNGSGSGGPDMNCPAVHFTAMPTTPTVQFLIDRSGSMDQTFGGGNVKKYDAVHTALTGPTGVVTQLQASVYFGASLAFDNGGNNTCGELTSVSRAKNNRAAIDGLFANAVGGGTPSPEWVALQTAEFVANPPVANSPPIVVFATDGEPNVCGGGNTTTVDETVAALKLAYATHLGANTTLPIYILGVGNGAAAATLQKFANAGAGVQAGQPDAPYYSGTNPATLAAAFQQIIGGVLSCDLTLSGQVNPATAQMDGTVILNGVTLTPGTDWTVDPNGTTLHIIGAACNTLKGSANPQVDATFACGSVIF